MFDGAFTYWREPPIIASPCLSVRPHVSAWFSLGAFLWLLTMDAFMIVCRENPVLFKLKQTAGLLRNRVVLLPASCNYHCGMRCNAKLVCHITSITWLWKHRSLWGTKCVCIVIIMNKTPTRCTINLKVLKIYLLVYRSTCFGHHRAHHQEPPLTAHAVSGHLQKYCRDTNLRRIYITHTTEHVHH
jgi:hypothetical protein